MKKLIVMLLLFCVVGLMAESWEVRNYVDEFGDKTDASYAQYFDVGTFSNKVATNDVASYKITYDKSMQGYMSVNGYEYNKYLVSSYSDHFCSLSIKYGDEKKVFSQGIFITSTGILINKDATVFILNNLRNGISMKLVFRKKDGDKYIFSIGSDGFNEAEALLK